MLDKVKVFKKKIPLVEQSHESECGIAVAAMILKYFGHRVTLLDLEDRYGVPRGGTTFSNLKTIFQDYGIRCRGIKVNDPLELRKVREPVICHWNQDHFVILEKISDELCTILDPAIGRLKISSSEFEDSFTGFAIVFDGLSSKITVPKCQKFNASLIAILKQIIKLLFVILGLTAIVQLLSLSLVFVQRWLIDYFLESIEEFSFITIALCVISCMVIYYIVQRARVLFITKFQLEFERRALYKFMDKMIEFPMRFFTIHGSGDLLFRINSTSVIQQILSQRILIAVIELCFAIIYFIVMLLFSPLLTCVVIVLTVITSIISIVYSLRNKELVSRGIHKEISAQEMLVEYFETIETFKSLGIEDRIVGRWKSKFGDKQVYDKKKGVLSANLNTLYDSLQFVLPISLLCIGLQLSVDGHLSLGTVISFLSLASSFLSPVSTVLESYTQLAMVKSYVSKVSEILDKEVKKPKKGISLLDEEVTSLSLQNVSFQYSSFDLPCVTDLSLKITEGDRIAIVGPSGSGKSTLLKLLSGTIAPTTGKVLLNGVSVERISRESICQRIAYCSQNSTIFNGTILENISVGRELAEPEIAQLIEISNKIGLTEVISSNPMGIYTNISKGGKNVSGGQQQRIVLARAIFSKADYLLLDEPTSALDNLAESKIFDYLASLSKTIVVVAHRLETIKHFDKIVVMNNGQIVESGSHDELLKLGGLYSKLYR